MLLPVNNHYTFHVSIIGDDTGLKYEGTFKVKCLLTTAEKVDIGLRIDSYNRGSKTLPAGISILNATLAELDVRVIDAPSFWKDADYGRNLLDNNIIYEVFKKATLDAETDFKSRLKEVTSNAEKAAEESVKKKAAKKEATGGV